MKAIFIIMVGELGEDFAKMLLSKQTNQGRLFKTVRMDSKWPTVDIYAEIISDLPQRFCFFQIKSTEQGYTKRQHKLKVSLDLSDLIRLSQYIAPTYIIGVDHNASEPHHSKAYIGTIRGNYTQGLSSLPTTYPLNDTNLITLRSEILQYWSSLNALNTKANYLTNFII